MRSICRWRSAVLRSAPVPDYYPSFDYLHVGELGDATDDLIARLARDPSRPAQQVVLKTNDRVAMTDFPIPAYELAEVKKYFLGRIQYSSGCPYQCEFCDIPGLYGRNPRLKTPQQIIAELDRLLECGVTGSVYFVDDNFIGNRKAALDLLPHLVEWQKKTGYVMRLACEATLNIAKRPEILEKMREAFFITIFCGIETPDPDALKAMQKDHNMMVPILEGVRTINSYGMEVVSGIIMGLDTDKPETGDALLAFVEQSNIPLLTINLLQALPKTPLWDRLATRKPADRGRQPRFQCRFPAALRPGRQFLAEMHGSRVRAGEALCALPASGGLHLCQPAQGAGDARAEELGQYQARPDHAAGTSSGRSACSATTRRCSGNSRLPRLRHGDIEDLIAVALVAHHLIMFARLASVGHHNASNYSIRLREAAVPAE